MKEKINKISLYIIGIVITLRYTHLSETIFFDALCIFLFALTGIVNTLLFWKEIDKKEWIKNNIFIVLYFALNMISIFFLDHKILLGKELIFEIYFVILVYTIYLKDRKCLQNLFFILIFLNGLLNWFVFLLKICRVEDYHFLIYTNPNGMGGITCICLIIFLQFFRNKTNKVVSIGYVIYSFVILLISEARSPIIMLIVYFLQIFILKYKIFSVEKLKKYYISAINLFLLIIIIFSNMMYYNIVPSTLENILNELSTNRYNLWKYTILSINKQPITGVGDSNIGEKRFDEIPKTMMHFIRGSRAIIVKRNNSHNGYIQLMATHGYLAYILFMLWFYQKTKKVSIKEFLIISSILTLNLFENEFMTSNNIHIFLVMYLLKTNDLKISDRKEIDERFF